MVNNKWNEQKKTEFDEEPVLKRMKIQLEKSNVKVNYTENIDLGWASKNIQSRARKKRYELLFEQCKKLRG